MFSTLDIPQSETINEAVEFIIYCRRSSDESQSKQVQSIPRQINDCLRYIESNNFKIKNKPNDFTDFENEVEGLDWESEEYKNVSVDAKKMYIVRESYSAKRPWKRKKWRKIISLIKKWMIKWVISYSPDRQSRNLLEWWEIVDLVDQELVTLKYSNFHFEPNAAGKMMLGVRFTLSKQYSDKLSEDTTVWMYNHIKAWKAYWRKKHWYRRNEYGFLEPHPEFFDLRKTAFQMYIEWSYSNRQIADWLRWQWYKVVKQREGKLLEPTEFNHKNMKQIWGDPFYYWLFVHWDEVIDQNITNEYYKPLITKAEYDYIFEKLTSRATKNKWVWRKDEFAFSFEEGFVIDRDWLALSCYITKRKKRYESFMKKFKNNSKLKFKDTLKSSQIYFDSNAGSTSLKVDGKKISIKQSDLEKVVYQTLKRISFDEDNYDRIKDFVISYTSLRRRRIIEEKQKLNIQINSIWSKILELKGLRINADKVDKDTIDKKLKQKIDIRERYQSMYDAYVIEDSSLLYEFEALFEIMHNAADFYKNSDNVRKKKITNIFISNLVVYPENRMVVRVHKELEDVISLMGRSTGLEPAILGTTNRCFTD